MIRPILHNLILLVLLLIGCEVNSTSPNDKLVVEVLDPSLDYSVYASGYAYLRARIVSGASIHDPLDNRFRDFGPFVIQGPWRATDGTNNIFVGIYGRYVSAPTIAAIVIGIPGDSVVLSAAIEVLQFRLHHFNTNVPNDTISVNRGGTFLLQFTGHDSLDNILSREFIDDSAIFSNDDLIQYVGAEKLTSELLQRDPLLYEVLIAAVPDAQPDVRDSVLAYKFDRANRTLHLPIKINY